MDKPPKKKESITEQEAGVQLVREIFFEFCHNLFLELENTNPAKAAELRPDFDQYIKVLTEVIINDPKGESKLSKAVQQIIPNNGWTQFMNTVMTHAPFRKKEIPQADLEEFRKDVEKRMKGEDIN